MDVNRTTMGKRLLRKRKIEEAQYEIIYHAVTGAKHRVKKRKNYNDVVFEQHGERWAKEISEWLDKQAIEELTTP